MMAEKPLAHEYIIEVIKKTIHEIERHVNPDVDSNNEVWILTANVLGGKLSGQIEMLKGFFIPEKHRGEVVDALREIKKNSSFGGIGEYICEEVFQAILSPPAEKAEEEAIFKRCILCGSLLAVNEGIQDEKGNWRCEIYCIG